jgi:hypothetical protein
VFEALLYLTEKYGRVFPSLGAGLPRYVLQAIGGDCARGSRAARLPDQDPAQSNSWTPNAANFHSKECSGDFRRAVVSRSLRNGAARWRSSQDGGDEQMFGAK